MPPAVAVAGISAGAGLLGGALQNRAAGQAANHQRAATNTAMAEERRRYDLEMAQRIQAREQRDGLRRAILARYGINLPHPNGGASQTLVGDRTGGPAGTPITLGTPGGGPSVGPYANGIARGANGSSTLNLSSLMGGQPSAPPEAVAAPSGPVPAGPGAPPPQNMTDLSGWSNWRNYGA